MLLYSTDSVSVDFYKAFYILSWMIYITCRCFILQILSPEFFLFEVYYGGRFSRQFECRYISGDVNVYYKPYDSDYLSFFNLEAIVKPFGYKADDLI